MNHRSLFSIPRVWAEKLRDVSEILVAESPPARRRVIQAFREAGATSPAMAQPFRARSRVDERAARELLEAGVLREAALGRYYLDLRALARWRRQGHWLDTGPLT